MPELETDREKVARIARVIMECYGEAMEVLVVCRPREETNVQVAYGLPHPQPRVGVGFRQPTEQEQVYE